MRLRNWAPKTVKLADKAFRTWLGQPALISRG